MLITCFLNSPFYPTDNFRGSRFAVNRRVKWTPYRFGFHSEFESIILCNLNYSLLFFVFKSCLCDRWTPNPDRTEVFEKNWSVTDNSDQIIRTTNRTNKSGPRTGPTKSGPRKLSGPVQIFGPVWATMVLRSQTALFFEDEENTELICWPVKWFRVLFLMKYRLFINLCHKTVPFKWWSNEVWQFKDHKLLIANYCWVFVSYHSNHSVFCWVQKVKNKQTLMRPMSHGHFH